MIEVPIPRTRNGGRLRYLERGSAVVVGDSGQPITRSVPGEIHIAIAPNRADLVFIPDEGTGDVTLKATEDARRGGWQIRDERDVPVFDSRLDPTDQWPLVRNAVVTLMFGRALNDIMM